MQIHADNVFTNIYFGNHQYSEILRAINNKYRILPHDHQQRNSRQPTTGSVLIRTLYACLTSPNKDETGRRLSPIVVDRRVKFYIYYKKF